MLIPICTVVTPVPQLFRNSTLHNNSFSCFLPLLTSLCFVLLPHPSAAYDGLTPILLGYVNLCAYIFISFCHIHTITTLGKIRGMKFAAVTLITQLVTQPEQKEKNRARFLANSSRLLHLNEKSLKSGHNNY